jgi:hypothetical protein
MNNFYSNEEYADIHYYYGKANGNGLQAKRMYSQAFPNRRCPHHETFQQLHQRLRESGSFSRRPGQGRPKALAVADEDSILENVLDDPSVSVREVAGHLNVCSPSTVWRTLKTNLLHPYHIQRVQALLPQDYPPRMNFCQLMVQNCNRYPHYLEKLLCTDESSFARDGIFNFHVYNDENPHAISESRHQHRFPAVNVWAGMMGKHLIGPVYLPNRLNGENYLEFLRNDLPALLEDVPLLDRRNHWFLHDGAPAHFLRNVRQHLDEVYGRKWIGRGGPVSWPARSPDLNPLDFCLWGWVKCLVYKTEIESEEDLRQRIENAFNHIRYQLRENVNISHSMSRRINACIAENGGHFEHLL